MKSLLSMISLKIVLFCLIQIELSSSFYTTSNAKTIGNLEIIFARSLGSIFPENYHVNIPNNGVKKFTKIKNDKYHPIGSSVIYSSDRYGIKKLKQSTDVS